MTSRRGINRRGTGAGAAMALFLDAAMPPSAQANDSMIVGWVKPQ